MPENRKVQNNAVENTSSDNIEEAIWRLKIQGDDNEEGDGAESSPYPDRPGEPDCIYYLRTGLCGYGSNCRFNHPIYAGAQFGGELPQRVGQTDCGYFLKTGTCKYGSTCKYNHPRDRHGAGPVSFNMLGLPMRQEEKPCPYYMRTGFCKFASACKFHHPQPSSTGNVVPVPGLAAFGSAESSILPSSGLPYAGNLPAWSLSKPPYVSNPQIQGPQGYMPYVVSPSQGILHAQGWNTYMGNMSPISSTSILGSSLAYNSRNQGESGSSGQVNLLANSIQHFPERPGEQECRYFMNNGTCKYGSDCKYNHPRERIDQLATNTVGPYGLPLRPGQAVCSHYSLYGICKFGPTCKFDHPVAGYPYNYSLSLSQLPLLDTSHFYPRNLPMAYPTEMTPPKSSKRPTDWNQKPQTASNKDQNSDAKAPEEISEQAGSPPQSMETPSETHDQSD